METIELGVSPQNNWKSICLFESVHHNAVHGGDNGIPKIPAVTGNGIFPSRTVLKHHINVSVQTKRIIRNSKIRFWKCTVAGSKCVSKCTTISFFYF